MSVEELARIAEEMRSDKSRKRERGPAVLPPPGQPMAVARLFVEQPWAPTRHKVGNLLEALAAITLLPQDFVQPCWLDGRRSGQIVAVQNGLLDIDSRELYPHTQTPEPPRPWLAEDHPDLHQPFELRGHAVKQRARDYRLS